MWLGYSVLNDAIWSWLFWLVTIRLNQGTLKFWIALVIVMFASSLLTGFIIGLIRSNDLIRKLASKLKINLEHPIPTGWEYKFFKQKEACWVIITLKTGICFRGYYGCNSLASSEQSYNDIFLELVYKEGKDGAWELVERTAGVVIEHIAAAGLYL